MKNKGIKYEHQLAKDISGQTDGELIPLGGGYNGKTSWDIDMLIDDGEAVHVFELKRTTQDGFTVKWNGDEQQDDDLYGLCEFCVNYPRPAYPYAGVRFDNKQLAITPLYVGAWPDKTDILDSAEQLCPYDGAVSHTRHTNLRFRRADSIPSARSGNDVQHVMDAIGYVF